MFASTYHRRKKLPVLEEKRKQSLRSRLQVATFERSQLPRTVFDQGPICSRFNEIHVHELRLPSSNEGEAKGAKECVGLKKVHGGAVSQSLFARGLFFVVFCRLCPYPTLHEQKSEIEEFQNQDHAPIKCKGFTLTIMMAHDRDIREASMRGSDAYGCDNTHKTKLIRPQYTMWYVEVMMWILLILGDPDSITQNHGVISGSCPVSSCIEPQQVYTSKQCYGLRAVSAVD
ncbi:uncharacterized protein LOC135611949 [Musa acuminata AAA Group]|uniref:uncharacterized protein LOC135586241 n=1 Tax=Musa acuminata AAA Group TaxID=214697 RepID=UPI0031D2983C